MRGFALGMLAVCTTACGDRTELFTLTNVAGEASTARDGGRSGADGGDATVSGDAEGADGAFDDGPDRVAPVPTCTGENSECIQNANGLWIGNAIVDCAPVDFVGPWTLLLERSINGQFETVQVQVVETPGFGATFNDPSSPANQVTYRVCVVDANGTRCGLPFTTSGSPDCACEPETCEELQACNTSVQDGCGEMVACGECTNGAVCNLAHNCCAPGTEPDGTGRCVCAPPHRCPRSTYWDTGSCSCQSG